MAIPTILCFFVFVNAVWRSNRWHNFPSFFLAEERIFLIFAVSSSESDAKVRAKAPLWQKQGGWDYIYEKVSIQTLCSLTSQMSRKHRSLSKSKATVDAHGYVYNSPYCICI